jgi:hypothetical protein
VLLVGILVEHSFVTSLGQGRKVELVPKVHFLETGEVGFKVEKLLE